MSSRFLRWFFAVFTTSLESQAINEPEGARALFIAAAEICEFFCALAWRARLRLGLGLDYALGRPPIYEGLVRCDGVKEQPWV